MAYTWQPSNDTHGFDYWLARGLQLKDDEQFVESSDCFDKAISLQPLNVDAWLGQAEAFFWQDRFQESYNCATYVTSFAPRTKGAWMAKGDSLMKLGRLSDAIDAYNSVLQLDPSDWEAYQGVGVCYFDLGQFGSALTSQQHAIDLLPAANRQSSLPPLLVEKGKALVELGRIDEALESYDEAIGLSATPSPIALIFKCRALFIKAEIEDRKRRQSGKHIFELIVKELDRIDEVDRDVHWWALRGNTFCYLDDCKTSLICHNTALELDPTNVSYKIAIANDKYYLGQLKEAAKLVEECLAAMPTSRPDLDLLELQSKIYGDLSAQNPTNKSILKKFDKSEKHLRKLKKTATPKAPRSPKRTGAATAEAPMATSGPITVIQTSNGADDSDMVVVDEPAVTIKMFSTALFNPPPSAPLPPALAPPAHRPHVNHVTSTTTTHQPQPLLPPAIKEKGKRKHAEITEPSIPISPKRRKTTLIVKQMMVHFVILGLPLVGAKPLLTEKSPRCG